MTAQELALLARDEPNAFVEFIGTVIDHLELNGMAFTFTADVLRDAYAWLDCPEIMATEDEFLGAVRRLHTWRDQQLQLQKDINDIFESA